MTKIKIFIVGGNGFIGSEVVKVFDNDKFEVIIPHRNEIFDSNAETDIVVYCAGNGDCSAPSKVIESNLLYLQKIISECQFRKLIYLSSTRLYLNSSVSDELSDVMINADDSRRLFNLTKLAAEECCLKTDKNILIIRPSNVYGNAFESKLFLPMIVKHAILNKQINMYVDKTYSKDYVSVSDVSTAVKFLALNYDGNDNVFNLASGRNTSALEIADIIQSKTACEIVWHPNTTNENFPTIDVSKIKGIMPYNPAHVIDDLTLMIDEFKERFHSEQ